MKITIKRVLLGLVYNLLDPQRVILRPALSRCRNKFLTKVNAERNQFEKDRREVFLAHLEKDEDGNPIWHKQGDEVLENWFDYNQVSEDKKEACKKDLEELIAEDFIYVENEENKIVFDALKLILVDLDITFQSSQESFLYDNLCEQLEVSLDDSLSSLISKMKG